MNNLFDREYWTGRYREEQTGWDIGYPAPALSEYFDQVENKSIKILIPGCGNAYEGEYLHRKGFQNVYLMDLSDQPKKSFLFRNPDFPEERFLIENFFEHGGNYDLLVEQTFFCAIDPSLRETYAKHCHQLLNPGGKLVGLLFDDTLNSDHPPFGGTKEEYLKLFEPLFRIRTFEKAKNSIKPRAGREFFMILEKN